MIAIAILLALRAAASLPVGFDADATTAHTTMRELKWEYSTQASPPSLPPLSTLYPPATLTLTHPPSPPANPPVDLVFYVIQCATFLTDLANLVRDVSASLQDMARQLHGYIMDFVKMLTTLDAFLGPAFWLPRWLVAAAQEAPAAPPTMPEPAAPPFAPPSPPLLPPSPPSRPRHDLGEVLDVYLHSVVPAIQYIYPIVFGMEWSGAGKWAQGIQAVYEDGVEAYTAYEQELLPALHDLEASISQAHNSTVYGSLAQLTDAVDELEQALRSLHAD